MQLRVMLMTFITLLVATKSFARDSYGDRQIHFREGIILGNYSGLIDNTLDAVSLFDFEYETFTSNRVSYFFRSTLGMDFEKNATNYNSVGGGMKYYFGSNGMYFNTLNRPVGISSYPRWRYFVGFGIGVSNIVLQEFGDLLTINSSNFDVGGNIGVIYQAYNNLGIELQYSHDISTGFTSVSVGGDLIRITLGVTYFL